MKKGLTQTLMAVAVVTMAIRIMALAPTISDIPSPVVGDKEDVTPGNTFVYPDAINLSTYVTDDTVTDPNQIIWSFRVEGTSKYLINGAASLGASDDVIIPPAANLIAGTDTLGSAADSDPAKVDANAYTITIRNSNLSPIGGPNVDPGATVGVINAETQAVTLWASDGTTASSKTVFFYTTNDENDSLSTSVTPTQPPQYSQPFNGGTGTGWFYTKLSGTMSSSMDATNGQVCLTAGTTGDNFGLWTSPYGALTLVQNSIYRVRLTMNSSQTTAGTVPFWDLTINNGAGNDVNSVHHNGMTLYGANYMVFDNVGGANAILGANANKVMDVWWCPPPVQTTQWNDTNNTTDFGAGIYPGPWAVSNANDRDAYIEFRVLDAANAALHGDASQGTLCLNGIQVDRYTSPRSQRPGRNTSSRSPMAASTAPTASRLA